MAREFTTIDQYSLSRLTYFSNVRAVSWFFSGGKTMACREFRAGDIPHRITSRGGILQVSYPIEAYPDIVDMLRNETPVILTHDLNMGYARLETGGSRWVKGKARSWAQEGHRPNSFSRQVEGLKEAIMSIWFFDDFPDLADYQALRREMRALEREYLEVRQLLAQAEEALRDNPGDVYLTARVAYYTKRRRGLEAKAPRLADEYPLEVALFLPPHG